MEDANVKSLCQAHGLDVVRVERRRGLLVLVPADLEQLPSVDVMQKISTELREANAGRWVSIDIGVGE